MATLRSDSSRTILQLEPRREARLVRKIHAFSVRVASPDLKTGMQEF
jgi:hypothetical protein